MEEVLLKYQEIFGTETSFTLKCLKRLNPMQLELSAFLHTYKLLPAFMLALTAK